MSNQHIYPEDGKFVVCRNVGLLSTVDAAYPQKLKFYTDLQPQKPKDKNWNNG
jgi:hypothetical protein